MIRQSIKLLSVLSFLLAVATVSCTDDNEEDLMPDDPLAQCNTEAVTFSGTVVPILAANCYRCHASSIAEGGVVLDNYEGVIEEAHHGHLVGVISHAPGFIPMPQDAPKLAECDIAKIRKWVDAGSPNN